MINCKDCNQVWCFNRGMYKLISCTEFKEKEVEKKEFDWSTVDKKYKWVATNSNGAMYLYTERPRIMAIEGSNRWVASGGDARIVHPCHNWKDTLIKRPKEKTDIYTIKAKLTKEQSVVLDVLLEQWEAENKE